MAQTAQAHIDSLVTGGQANALALQQLAEDALDTAATVSQGGFFPGSLPPHQGPNFGADFDLPDPPQFTEQFEQPLPTPDFNVGVLQPFYQAVLQEIPAPPDEIETSDLFKANKPGMDASSPPDPPEYFGGLPSVQAPSLNDVTVPNFVDINIPPSPTVGTPAFNADDPGLPPELSEDLVTLYNTTLEGKMPLFRTVVDDATAAFVAAYYPGHAGGMVDLEARISTDLAGGTGYSTTVRQALLDAARSEIAKGLVDAERSAYESAARRGFTLPPGALGAALLEAQRDANDKTSRAELEIVKQTADQEQSNAQNAIQVASSLRTAVAAAAVQFAGLVLRTNEQALQAANQIVAVVVEAYNVRVAAYRATLDYYTAKIRLFEIAVRAAMVDVELYQARIRGEELKAKINDNLVSVMQAKIQAEEVKVRLYESRIRTVTAELERRSLVVQVYGEEVRAYSARLNAKNAEFSAYAASLAGDEALLRARLAAYQRYEAEVRGVVAFNQVEGQKQAVVGDYNRAVIAQFDSEWNAYRARFDTGKINHDTQLQDHLAEVQYFQEKIRQLSGEAEVNLRAEVAKTDHSLKAADLALRKMDLTGTTTMQKVTRNTEAYTSAATAYAGMAEAALSGLLAGAVEEYKVTSEETP